MITIKFDVFWVVLREIKQLVSEKAKCGVLRRLEVFSKFFFYFPTQTPHQTLCVKFQHSSKKFHFYHGSSSYSYKLELRWLIWTMRSHSNMDGARLAAELFLTFQNLWMFGPSMSCCVLHTCNLSSWKQQF